MCWNTIGGEEVFSIELVTSHHGGLFAKLGCASDSSNAAGVLSRIFLVNANDQTERNIYDSYQNLPGRCTIK